MTNLSIEFWAWRDIPADRKREVTCDGDTIDKEVLGETFLGEPIWLPWMGGPCVGPDGARGPDGYVAPESVLNQTLAAVREAVR